MDKKNTNVTQLFVVLTAAVFGSSMAVIIGPYLLIIVAAITGAAWSLGRRESKGKLNSLFYFVRIVLTAILLTVGIARLMASYVDGVEAEWLIVPVALIIGVVGDDWMKAFNWGVNAVKKMADKLLKKKLDEL